ncbi:DUF1254 domain-containing protein [Ruegeria pomeroyi]|nr:DUF1254 domain-containing protein [Ruegeria pomeroyi]
MIQSKLVAAALACAVGLSGTAVVSQDKPGTREIADIAREATVYALPMLMNYGIMYEYAIAAGNPQFRAPFNTLYSEANVFTYKDRAVVTPNSDTPYSFVWMDLRAEPMVLCVPEIEKSRYYSVQLISQYTYNFGYIGSRSTGNEAGCYAIAGPEWSGDTPEGIEKVFQSGTQFALGLFRTQLFNAADIDNVRAIQAKYSAKPLSAFLGTNAPAAVPAIDWPAINKDLAKKDPFGYLSFLLQFAPTVGIFEEEKPLRAKFASVGIEPGAPFPSKPLTETEIEGMKAAAAEVHKEVASLGKLINGWQVAEGLFGDRKMMGDNYTLRAAAAIAGIYGNDSAEALYPLAKQDADGNPLDGSTGNYTLTFAAGELPPVNAFWSVTMYDGKTQLLIENPINRYLINSSMLPDLKKGSDGSLTLYIQSKEPNDPDQKANWLPAPDGPIYMVMRLYWPKDEALNGNWKPPAVTKSN